MKALLILAIAGLLAWLYGRALKSFSGEEMMTLGVLVLLPWIVIAIGTVVALVVWS